MFAIGRILGTALATFLLAGAAVADDGLRETRPSETQLGEEGFESPPASIEQLDWLVGQWSGEGIQGAPAMESWLPPLGGTMVGTFVQETDEGAIMFTEHMYIVEDGDSLALKLKHFNADLTGWEEKDDMLTFRLVAIEECAAYFNALTLRCADADMPGEGLVAAVRMQSGEELVFRFERQSPPLSLLPIDHDCEDSTMRGLEECFSGKGEFIAKRHERYLAAVRARYADEPELLIAIEKGEATFEEYSKSECSAVYESFGMGSIRNLEYTLCADALQQARTHTLWQNWLTFSDNTEPVLPEPKPLR